LPQTRHALFLLLLEQTVLPDPTAEQNVPPGLKKLAG